MQPDNKPIAPFGQEAAVSENAQQFITFTLGAEE